jgi:hypothetical protein
MNDAAERSETISMLREICAEFGDTNWSPNSYIPDIIEKHLLNHLREMRDELKDVLRGDSFFNDKD